MGRANAGKLSRTSSRNAGGGASSASGIPGGGGLLTGGGGSSASLSSLLPPRSSRVAMGEDADDGDPSDSGRETSDSDGSAHKAVRGASSAEEPKESDEGGPLLRRASRASELASGGGMPPEDDDGDDLDENGDAIDGLRHLPVHRLSVSTTDEATLPASSASSGGGSGVTRPHPFKVPSLILPSATPHSRSGSTALATPASATGFGGGFPGRARFLDLKLVCPSPERAAPPVSKEDKLLFFSRLCSVLTPFLCVGSRLIAQDWRQFVRHGQWSGRTGVALVASWNCTMRLRGSELIALLSLLFSHPLLPCLPASSLFPSQV